jgi:hypothetical protein
MTRKALKAMGLTEEQIDSIIEMHTETVDGLREQVNTYKADAQKLPTVQKELDDLKKGDGKDYKSMYEAEKTAHDKTKSDHAAEKTAAQIKDAYRALLKEAGVADKYLNTALKATNLSEMKLDKDGKLENAETLTESAKTEWADFIQTTTTQGAKVVTPPKNNGGKYSSREEIMKIKDATERQAAIAANLELFQK